MKHFLFVMLPYSSHYMSCFALAKEFEKNGNKVLFTVNNPNLEILVRQNGFECIRMVYQTEEVIPNLKYFFSLFILSMISKSFLLKRYKEFYANIFEVKRLVNLTKSDFVFMDAHLYQYYFYFLSEQCNVFLLNTKLLTSQQGNNAPLSTNYLPKSNFFSRIINELLWLKVVWQHQLKALTYKLSFLGRDDNFFLKRFCQNQNISYSTIINKRNNFYYGLKNVKRILLAPEYLDSFALKNEAYHYYICLEYSRKEDSMLNNPCYMAMKAKIAQNNSHKIILCSFGTIINEKDKTKIDFLNRLNRAVRDENYFVIVVAKNPNIINNKYSNVCILPSIPQLDLLKNCDLMIHHAGLNTIKECLQFQVPMLIYTPKENSFDRIGNAARINSFGLGIVGDIYKDTPTKIKENIEKTLTLRLPKPNFEEEYTKLEKFMKAELNNNNF